MVKSSSYAAIWVASEIALRTVVRVLKSTCCPVFSLLFWYSSISLHLCIYIEIPHYPNCIHHSLSFVRQSLRFIISHRLSSLIISPHETADPGSLPGWVDQLPQRWSSWESEKTCLKIAVVCLNWQMWGMVFANFIFNVFLAILSLTSNVVNILLLPAMTSVFVCKWISAWHIYDLRAFYLSPCFAPIRDKALHLNEYWVNITKGTKDPGIACFKKTAIELCFVQ